MWVEGYLAQQERNKWQKETSEGKNYLFHNLESLPKWVENL